MFAIHVLAPQPPPAPQARISSEPTPTGTCHSIQIALLLNVSTVVVCGFSSVGSWSHVDTSVSQCGKCPCRSAIHGCHHKFRRYHRSVLLVDTPCMTKRSHHIIREGQITLHHLGIGWCWIFACPRAST